MIGNGSMAAPTSQTTTSCPYVRASQYTLLLGYTRAGHSPPYINYEFLKQSIQTYTFENQRYCVTHTFHKTNLVSWSKNK